LGDQALDERRVRGVRSPPRRADRPRQGARRPVWQRVGERRRRAHQRHERAGADPPWPHDRGSICCAAMPRAAVLGPGGVGGFLAAALARAGDDVTLVARARTAERINRDGLTVRSARLGDFKARPAVVTTLEEPVEALFVATKSTGLAAGLERIRAAP